ncbi:MAG: YdcF family protein [Campylobacterales bacterium]|nr:YdcF family protein [Campylobacterales bacterium]
MLKKIISAFIMPLPFFVLIGLMGLWFLYRNSLKKAKIFLTLSLVGIMLFSYNPVANKLLNSLEAQYQPIKDVNESIEYVLLLGGDFDLRAYGVLQLYHQNPKLKIITSGYEGREEIPEAIINKAKLIALGIPKESIIAHPKPKDTKSEAIAMKKVVGNAPFYLVTSATHIPRAMALFKRQGLSPIAAPSGFLERKTLWLGFVGASEAYKSQIAWHEYVGLLWSRLKGDI